MRLSLQPKQRAGLNLVEVVLVVGTVALLALVFYPRLTRPKARVTFISCTTNLKQIGLSYRLFSNDHDDKFPFAVSNESGGTLGLVNSPQVFHHFEAMSNELVTPKVLVCPTDRMNGNRIAASNFFSSIANSNVSYFVGLDADESKSERLLSGDRNITGGKLNQSWLQLFTPVSPADWTGKMHLNNKTPYGNIGLSDGSVLQMEAPRLRQQLQSNRLAVTRPAIP